jgi:hypothetical protein
VSLSGQLDDWSDALQIIRAARNPDASKPSNLSAKSRTNDSSLPTTGRLRERSNLVASQFAANIASGVDIDFDAAFNDAPIGESGTKAVYWIHQEQLIELQVVLLQLLRLYVPKGTLGSSSTHSQTPVVTRRSSLSRHDSQVDKDNDCGVIVLDQLEDYANRHIRSTVSDTEESFGTSFTKPVALARWTSAEEAVVSLRQFDGSTSSGTTKVRKKYLGALLNSDSDFSSWISSGTSTPVEGPTPAGTKASLTPKDVRNLLRTHKEIQPLVGIFSRRTRFVGLSNTSAVGQWCILDAQISVSKVQKNELVGKEWAANIGRDITPFPFAVLQVRREGALAKSIIDILDKSHLVRINLEEECIA